MQINRLFKIVYILLDKERISAKELADYFEVSTRTIYRDVEMLSSCGIPIYMSKGKNGGISLLPDFVLNKTVLTNEERSNILSALHNLGGLDEISVQDTLSKLSLFFGENNTGFIEVDYSDWGNLIKEQFEQSKKAILSRKVISFDYVSAKGQSSQRRMEPYVLWFKDRTWYLKGFCLMRHEPRVFRLSRMRNVVVTEQIYIPRENDFSVELEERPDDITKTKIVVRMEESQEHRILDDFAQDDVVHNPDGSFTVTMHFIEDEWVYGYILSFGSSATVLEPPHIKEIIKKRLQESLNNYL